MEVCGICLKYDLGCSQLCETGLNGEKYSAKLSMCVSEVDWQESWLICTNCANILEVVIDFRTQCIQTNLVRLEEASENNSGSVCYEGNDNNKELVDDKIQIGASTVVTDLETENASILNLTETSVNLEENRLEEDLCINQKLSTVTSSSAALIEEIKVDNTYMCYHCNKEFNSKTFLSRHLKKEHLQPKAKKEESDNQARSEDGACVIQEIIVEKPATKKPRKRITKFTCEFCPETFKNSIKYREHATDSHGKKSNEIRPFQCLKCENRFASSSNLIQHNKYHDGNRTNVCTYCGKGFITISDLLNHEKQHLNKREYECKFCPKRFNTHKDLRSHKIIKHEDKSTWNYECNLCRKRFHIKPNYEIHMRRHNGQKPFTCRMCEKSFITKDELRKHMISHTNIRAFRCDVCGKEYKDKRVLDIHSTKIHGIGNAKVPVRVRKHFCDVCPKSFFDKYKLTRHMFSHSGVKPFPCGMCEKKFTDKSYVKQHLKAAHNVVHVEGSELSEIVVCWAP